jgi:hypothetical protein
MNIIHNLSQLYYTSPKNIEKCIFQSTKKLGISIEKFEQIMEKYIEKRDFPSYDQLNEEGYLIVSTLKKHPEFGYSKLFHDLAPRSRSREHGIPKIFSKEDLEEVATSIKKNAFELIFESQGYDVDAEDPESLKLFTDMKKRKEMLGEDAARAIWRGGNTLAPLIGKTTGMIHIHFNEDVQKRILFNKKLYKLSSYVNGTPYLSFITGPERVSIKAQGSTDMDSHMDSNPFYPSQNYPFRIQSLIVLEIDEHISPRDRGTLSIIPYFHHYWEFFGKAFHPVDGIEGYRFPPNTTKSRFFPLPKGKNNFDKIYLPKLKNLGKQYSKYLYHDILPESKTLRRYFRRYKKEGISVPPNSKKYLEKMVWKPLPLKEGDIVFWHQHLPHRSLRNKSEIPRVVVYYNLFPVDEAWFGSEEAKWVAEQFETGKFYYGKDYGNYPKKVVNIEEYKSLKDNPKRLKKILAIFKKTELNRKLAGLEDWFSE